MTITHFQKIVNRKSEGSILIVAIMMLVILTLIGIAATTTSDIESQISANDLYSKQAFYASESGLNVTAAFLVECVNTIKGVPQTSSICPLKSDGTTPDSTDTEGEKIRLEVLDPVLNDPQKDIRMKINDVLAEIDFQTKGSDVEAGGGSEFTGSGQAAPSSTFKYFDLDATGQGPKGASYRIQAGCRILVEGN